MTSQIILAKVSAIHTTTADCGSHKERDGSEWRTYLMMVIGYVSPRLMFPTFTLLSLDKLLLISLTTFWLSMVWEGFSDGTVQVKSFVTGLHCQDLQAHRSEVSVIQSINQLINQSIVCQSASHSINRSITKKSPPHAM